MIQSNLDIKLHVQESTKWHGPLPNSQLNNHVVSEEGWSILALVELELKS